MARGRRGLSRDRPPARCRRPTGEPPRTQWSGHPRAALRPPASGQRRTAACLVGDRVGDGRPARRGARPPRLLAPAGTPSLVTRYPTSVAKVRERERLSRTFATEVAGRRERVTTSRGWLGGGVGRSPRR